MRIQVTAGDIRKARREIKANLARSRYCPIAQAIKRQCPAHAESVRVGCNDAQINGQWAELPRTARDFIGRFDNTGKAKPQTFIVPALKC